jgi:hypothetical protein
MLRKFKFYYDLTTITGTLQVHSLSYLAHFFLGPKMFQTKVVKKIKTQSLCSISPPPPENRAVYEIMWKNIVQPDRQATDDSIAHAHCVLNTKVYKHTLRVCNSNCFPTVTKDARQRLSINLCPQQTNHVPTVTFNLHFNIISLYRDSSDLVCSGVPAKLFYAFLCPLTGATSLDHLMPMELVVLIIFHESSSLRSFFYTFPLLLPFQVDTSILLRTRPQTHSSYIMMTALWDVTCPVGDRHHVYRRTWCLYPQSSSSPSLHPYDGKCKLFRNVGTCLPNKTA